MEGGPGSGARTGVGGRGLPAAALRHHPRLAAVAVSGGCGVSVRATREGSCGAGDWGAVSSGPAAPSSHLGSPSGAVGLGGL